MNTVPFCVVGFGPGDRLEVCPLGGIGFDPGDGIEFRPLGVCNPLTF